MKIQITIPESDVADVKEYCRIEGIDLHGRLQIELDIFVANALCQMEQRRRSIKGIANFRGLAERLNNAD